MQRSQVVELPPVGAPMQNIRHYLLDGANGHDAGVIQTAMSPRYAFRSGTTQRIGRDRAYVPMIQTYLAHDEPTLHVTPQWVIAGGDYVAVRLTKQSTGPAAAWDAITIARDDGQGLSDGWSEQDWLGRKAQFRSGVVAPLLSPRDDVWPVEAGSYDEAAETVVLDWLETEGCHPSPDLVDNAADELGESPRLRILSTTVNCIFATQGEFAFHVTYHGLYDGGLADTEKYLGLPAEINMIGMGTVQDDQVASVHLIRDRQELKHRLPATKLVVDEYAAARSAGQ